VARGISRKGKFSGKNPSENHEQKVILAGARNLKHNAAGFSDTAMQYDLNSLMVPSPVRPPL
jgi:hypothetical protein